jgi:prevent-host-death family protein
MKTHTSVVSLSQFKANAAQMLEDIKATERDIVLTQNGAATAVVQDYESYQRLQDALAMMKLMVQGEADVKEGRTTPQNRVFSDLKKHLASQDA